MKFKDCKPVEGLVGPLDISSEEWREYSWLTMVEGKSGKCHYRITKPIALYFKENGFTHRVVDSDGITHCIPAVGVSGCALTWKGNPKVSF